MVAEKEDSEDESLAIDCPVLVTERLVLRAPREDDIPELAVLADNRHVAEMLARMPHPYGEAEARAFVQSIRGQRRAGSRLCADACRHRRLHRLRRAQRHGARPGARLLDRRALLEARLCDRGGACAGRPRLPGDRDRGAAVSCRVINPASRRVIHKCGFQYAGQGMMNSIVAGQVPVERYRLDRKTWVSLRSWG